MNSVCQPAEILLGTILIEPNRWLGSDPSVTISRWLPRFRADGFDGVDLMQRHALGWGREEMARLQAAADDIRLFNSYVRFGDEAEQVHERKTVAAAIRRLAVRGVKIGLGRDTSRKAELIANLQKWSETLPEECTLLLEAHDGMLGGTPDEAARILAPLPTPRFGVIIHALSNPDTVRHWFDATGERIAHTHLNRRNERGEGILLKEAADSVRACLDVLKQAGYRGGHTLEFTAGIRTPAENPEMLYRNAVQDLAFLREALR